MTAGWSPSTATAQWKSLARPVFTVRTRNRAVTASADRLFMRLVQVARSTTHREAAEWAGPVRAAWGEKGQVCTVSTCSRPLHAVGLCTKHLTRYNVHGDPRVWKTTSRVYEVRWARLDELRRGDLLVQPRSMATEQKADPELSDGTPVDADVAWLIGAAVGDGTVIRTGLRLCLFGEKRDRATSILRDRWGCKASPHATAGIIASSVVLASALSALGMMALGPNKLVPQAVWQWPADLQRSFLDGYCDADGHRPADRAKHGDRTYHSASRDLIEDVRALHIMLGDPVSNISTTRRKPGLAIKGKVIANPRPLHTFTVWAGAGRGEAALRSNRGRGMAAWLDAGEFTVSRVLGVTDEGVQDTYDIDVEDAHNFVADGVIVTSRASTPAAMASFGP